MMRRGPLIPTLAFATGIAGSYLFGLPWWSGVIPIVLAITIYLCFLNASKDPVVTFRIGRWHLLWVILLFIGIGITDESLTRPINLLQAYSGNLPDSIYCEVTGVLSKTYGERIDVIIEGTNGAKARIYSGASEVSPGDILMVPTGSLKEISSDTTELGRRIMPMLKASGILYTGRILPKSIVITGRSLHTRYLFICWREKLERTLERSHLKKSTSDFLNAILMGDKSGLDEQTRMTFASGGMAHMLALSGLHIGILAGFLTFLLWPIKLAGRYKWVYAVTLLVLWLYVAVTGMSYSSVRACIMTTFAFIGIIAERKNFASDSLSSACMLILIVDPSALFDAGFQLSVVCVAALIAFASRLNPVEHRRHPVLFYICGSVIATMVATCASWTLISYYFSQIPLMFLPSNLLILPVLPFYISMALIFLLLLSSGWEISWMESVLDRGYEYLAVSIEKLSYGSEFVIDYQVPLWGVAVWMLLLASGAYAINRKSLR